MARNKVKVAFIIDDAKRKATYKKRKKGLLNKVSEISTLCGINACAIIHSPYDPEPVVWPSTMDAEQVVSLFKSLPKMEQTKNMLNQETFLRQRIAKVNQQLKKQQTANRNEEITEVMFQCMENDKRLLQHLKLSDLQELGCKIRQTLKEVDKRIEAATTDCSLEICNITSTPTPTVNTD